jgi:lactoylglutathione lyase
MSEGRRIRHTNLRVRDLDKSVDFYTRLLGMEVQRRRDNPDEQVAYVGYGEESENHALELTFEPARTAPFEIGNCYGHVALGVSDIEGLCAMLETAGVEFRKPLGPVRPGSPVHVAFIHDPDGYEIELTERR